MAGGPGAQKLEHRREEEEREAGVDADSDCPQEGDTALTIPDHYKRRDEPLEPPALPVLGESKTASPRSFYTLKQFTSELQSHHQTFMRPLLAAGTSSVLGNQK